MSRRSNRRFKPPVGVGQAPGTDTGRRPAAGSQTGPRRDAGRKSTGSVGSRLGRWAFIAFLVIAAVAALAIVGLGTSAAMRKPVTAVRPAMGNANAPVTLLEFSDYQCQYCGAWAGSVEPQIVQTYVDTGKVRFEWYDMPWEGPESKTAANAARCAGDQGQYWQYHDLLYEKQGAMNSGAFSTANLKAFGAQLGLDTKTFDACVDSNKYAAAVQADFNEALRRGINGTPAFFVNGQRIVGDQPFATFQAAIDAALAGR